MARGRGLKGVSSKQGAYIKAEGRTQAPSRNGDWHGMTEVRSWGWKGTRAVVCDQRNEHGTGTRGLGKGLRLYPAGG